MRELKKIGLILFAALSICCFKASAQRPGFRRAQPLQNEQIAKDDNVDIVKKLGLQGDDAEKFRTLYAEYKQAILETEVKADKSWELLTDQELEEKLKAEFNANRMILDLKEAYYAKFSEFLDSRQLYELYLLDSRKRFGPPGGQPGRRPADF